MMDDHLDSFDELFEYIYKGNNEAKDLSFKLLEIAHTWDDLVDKDKDVKGEMVNTTFITCLYELQRNQIWFSAGLDHHVLNVYLRWRDANSIESDKESTDNDLSKSYMLRAGLYDLFVIMAYHLFGDKWAAEVGPVIRKFYGETLKEYIEEMRNA